ncbi:MAG: alpha/beta fold hydrolase [Planctomycetes bacterium]|nr:alpha/beta fold hydrolase [Planctomycetota bacterium]
MRWASSLLVCLSLLAMLALPAAGQDKKAKDPKFKPPAPKIITPPAPSFKHLDGQMLVFAVNGVNGSTVLSDNLLDVNSDLHLGLRIQMIPWCRHNAFFADLVDHEAQIMAAGRIAESVKAIRKDAPKANIIFIGHSAGARVVLAAAEMLPAKSVDRIFVLAPAVSYCYDLTGALKAARHGIDNFYSSEDSILDRAVDHKGTADGLRVHAAGRVGFHPTSTDKKDLELYRNLRQIRWTEKYCGSGGHFTWVIQHNLKRTVVPQFFTAPCDAPAVKQTKEPPIKN